MKKSINGTVVSFTFDDGVAPYVFDTDKVSAECKAYAIPFGFSHRLGDSAAIPRKDKEGKVVDVTEAMRREAVAQTGDYYLNGATTWESRQPRVQAPNPAITKLAEKRGITYAEAEAWIVEQAMGDM